MKTSIFFLKFNIKIKSSTASNPFLIKKCVCVCVSERKRERERQRQRQREKHDAYIGGVYDVTCVWRSRQPCGVIPLLYISVDSGIKFSLPSKCFCLCVHLPILLVLLSYMPVYHLKLLPYHVENKIAKW